MNLKTLKGQVEYCLKWKKETRNSDISLMISVWNNFYKDFIKDGAIKLESLYKLPREDNIKRIRAKFQNEENKYLPTDLEVVRKRKINEDKWRQFMGYDKGAINQSSLI